MLNLYDDLYEAQGYPCSGCDQKDYLLREAAVEINNVMDSLSALKKAQSDTEKKLLNNLENVCHMMGIPFKWS